MGADLYGKFYFQDPYNDSSVLWQFGLSWWKDVTPLLKGEGMLNATGAKKILDLMEARQLDFNLAMDDELPENRRWYRAEARKLRELLTAVVEENIPIRASL